VIIPLYWKLGSVAIQENERDLYKRGSNCTISSVPYSE
ncbi:hypothetical protein CCACVL1_08417, partial [Corchorus capsularis]